MAITIDGDSGVSGVNGSATTPALQGTDSNTGVVFGTDTVQIATGGSTRATVDSSGHLGLGTTSPAALGGDGGRVLHVAGANNPEIVLERTTSGTEFKSSIRITDSENLTFCIKDGSASANNAMSIDSSGRLLIGNTSNFANANADNLVIGSNSSSAESGITLGSTHASGIRFADSGSNSIGIIEYIHSDDSMRLATAGSERMRMTSDGSLLVGKTNADFGVAGSRLYPSGEINFTRNDGVPVFVRRNTSDGILVSFYQDGNQEGTIQVSGSTVSYNGGHLTRWSQLAGGAERTEILRGSVLSNLDEMCEWAYDAQDAVLYTEEDELPEGVSVGDVKTPAVAAGTENNEQLNRMKVSDVEGDPNVSGVFQGWDDDDDTYTNDFYCAMTGDFVIRIAQGTTVARGDLLMSAGDGTAKPQGDDIVRSKTIAKVTSTTVSTTYTDGSYCVPCVLMAC